MEWLINYEKLHNKSHPILALELTFHKQADKTVKIVFKSFEGSSSSSTTPAISYSYMISTIQGKYEKSPTVAFHLDGIPIHIGKINGHFTCDALGLGM